MCLMTSPSTAHSIPKGCCLHGDIAQTHPSVNIASRGPASGILALKLLPPKPRGGG